MKKMEKSSSSKFEVRRLLRDGEGGKLDITEAAMVMAAAMAADPRNSDNWDPNKKMREFNRDLLYPFMLKTLMKRDGDGEAWGIFSREETSASGDEPDRPKMLGAALFIKPSSKSKKPPLGKLLKIVVQSVRKYPGETLRNGTKQVKLTIAATAMCETVMPSKEPSWMVMGAGVLPGYQSEGLGTTLLKAVLDKPWRDDDQASKKKKDTKSQPSSAETFAASAFCTNERNVKFLEALGFKTERILTPQFDNIMCKTWLLVRPANYVYPSDAAASGPSASASASDDNSSRSSGTAGSQSSTQFWMIPFEDLELGKKLASGSFGAVYKGLYRGNDCVVKQLHDKSEEARLDLLREADAMAQVRPHASVCAFYGVCASENSPLCVVTELIAGGSLLDRIKDRQRPLTSRDVLQLSRDLASGLQHIHSNGLIHADVAARNCLVVGRDPLRLRICDFGLSRKVEGDEVLRCAGITIPIRWSPPEAWIKLEMAKSFDVWAFAVTIWEIMSFGDVPYAQYMRNQDVMAFVKEGGRLQLGRTALKHLKCAQALYEILLQCWIEKSAERPRFENIVKSLTGLMDTDASRDGEKGDEELTFMPEKQLLRNFSASEGGYVQLNAGEKPAQDGSASAPTYHIGESTADGTANGSLDTQDGQKSAPATYSKTPSHIGETPVDDSDDAEGYVALPDGQRSAPSVYGRTPVRIAESPASGPAADAFYDPRDGLTSAPATYGMTPARIIDDHPPANSLSDYQQAVLSRYDSFDQYYTVVGDPKST